jgi:hypothetical protein
MKIIEAKVLFSHAGLVTFLKFCCIVSISVLYISFLFAQISISWKTEGGMPAASAHCPPPERGNRVRLKDVLQKKLAERRERERERELTDELSLFLRFYYLSGPNKTALLRCLISLSIRSILKSKRMS